MDYSELPEELVEKIASDHLTTFSQLTAFSGVCKSWRTTARRPHSSCWPTCIPGLLVPKAATASQSLTKAAYYNSGRIHEFYPLATVAPTTTTTLPPPQPIPSANLSFFPSPSKISDALGQRHRYLRLHHDLDFTSSFDHQSSSDNDHYSDYSVDLELPARCLGSKDGWILRTLPSRPKGELFERQPQDLYLLNPLTGASIPLPPHPAYSPTYSGFISKAIISSSPDHDDEECHVIIVSMWDPQLAWCKLSSSESWHCTGGNPEIFSCPHGAAYFGGKLYVADRDQGLFLLDLTKTTSTSSSSEVGVGLTQLPVMRLFSFSEAMTLFSRGDDDDYGRIDLATYYHLCHINDQLYVILQNWDWKSVSFQVFKLVLEGGHRDDISTISTYDWEEVRSLDGHAVFIGPHQSFAILATINGSGGVRGDHIYFAKHFQPRPKWRPTSSWYGVFNLADQKLETLVFEGDRYREKYCWEKYCRAFWFLPMTWDISKLHKHDDCNYIKHNGDTAGNRVLLDLTKENLQEEES